MRSNDIKLISYDLGADLCGIASIDRFGEAPKGFHPCDVLPSCKSVVVFAKQFLSGPLHCSTTVPYTIIRNMLSDKLDKLSFQFCETLERNGIIAVPTGTIGPTEYDTATDRYRNIVSAKHCAVAAGLGRIGRNTLLITPEYGNMVWLCAVLLNTALEPDKMLLGNPCPAGCSICIDNCPVHALGEAKMKQTVCSAYAFGSENGGNWKIKCNKCRTVCPSCFGSKNSSIK
ncbi:MAG: epoxyqueuosine reductase [Lachnospiraceae bacterium]